MQRNRSTKIIATLGPASSDPKMIAALHVAGVDLFRLNFSHGEHGDHQSRLTAISEVEQMAGTPIGVIADLQGPKIRIGTITGGAVELLPGASFRLDLTDRPGDGNRAPLPHPEVFAALESGMDLLIDDGKIRLTVLEAGADFAGCEVVTGGRLSDRKGVNLPQALLPMGAMTTMDQADLRFALDAGVDWVALSFVQRPEDIAEARRLIAGRAAIMAKIEKPAAMQQIDEIIELSDAIMVARGDLGVELPVEEVPALQKDLVRRARRAGKPVVVATQMLESMIAAPVPTRAEVSDVATAVYDGADAVMLSGETAAGAHPLAAVEVMDRVATKVEGDPGYRNIMDSEHADPEATSADAITAAARQVAGTISASAIVTYTTSGSTALRAARERPPVPILVLTPSLVTARRLAVAWGLSCVHSADASGFTDMVDRACRAAADRGIALSGDRLVITAGVPFGTPGATNSLRIAWVP
ncbi:MAG: pyruvate kinase [Alphaproteobacteria bacterium]|nr:pyruvate kinase [Alphaproteobacteria bacterium]